MLSLEARAIIENTGNYDEDDIDSIEEIYEDVIKHIGFQDNRRDSRFIVKFHDIFYYMPEEYEKVYGDSIDFIFEDFCDFQYETIMDNAKEEGINIANMLTRYDIGHYKGFIVNIPEITQENAIEIAMEIFDQLDYDGKKYASDYVYVVNMLQNLEDN